MKNAHVTELIGKQALPRLLTVNASATSRLARRGRPGVVVLVAHDVHLRCRSTRCSSSCLCRTQAVALRVSLVVGHALCGMLSFVVNLLLCAAVPQLFTRSRLCVSELIVFCVMEMRYLLLVWQAHDPQRNWDAAGWVQLRGVSYRTPYVALAVVLSLYASGRAFPIAAASSYWVPQIIEM